MGLDMIRYDWYRVAPAELGNFLKSLSRYEILRDQSTTFGQHFSGSCSSRCCQTALLRPTVYSHFGWRCGMPKELWWVSVNFQGKCGTAGKCLWVICIHLYSFVFICIHLYSFVFICIHLYSFVFICIHLCSSERTNSICTVKIISGIALTPISFRVCPCWCRRNAARSASLNWPDGREFASKGGGACPVGAVACGCGNEGSKWPLKHPQTTTPAVRCNAVWSRNPGCAFKVGSLGHEPPQKDTHSEFHIVSSRRIRSPKLGVLGALLAPFSLDRWRTGTHGRPLHCSSWPWTYPTNMAWRCATETVWNRVAKKSRKSDGWRNDEICVSPGVFGDRVRNVWAQGEEAWSIVKPLIVRLCCFMMFHDCSMCIYGFYCEEWWKPGRTEFDASTWGPLWALLFPQRSSLLKWCLSKLKAC